ncbi:MAG TPA: hypothetical protein VM737_12200 [Gemmatimonadota bacterium]|nr:hypothetical protein [Gemmatimonadota bacterium]
MAGGDDPHSGLKRALLGGVLVLTALQTPRAAAGQTLLPMRAADTLEVASGPDLPSSGPPSRGSLRLATGEAVAVWILGGARVPDPGAGPGPVGEAAAGEVIARFGDSGWFAWPLEPVVWTAPRPGMLEFALNLWPGHGDGDSARVVLVLLGAPADPTRHAFPPPSVFLERVPGGVRARYSDRAGFGLDTRSLRLTLTTARGTVYRLGPWVRPGPQATTLPLPPPEVPLPAGIHTLTATIEDRVGNAAPAAKITFDAVQ